MRLVQLPEDIRGTAELLVSELVTNAVKYGQPPLWLLIEMRPGLIHASVSDTSTVLPQRRTAAPDAEGGRGLLVLDALAGSWGTIIAESGKYLWFDLPVPHTSAPAGDGAVTATAPHDDDLTPASARTAEQPAESARVAAESFPTGGRPGGPASPSPTPDAATPCATPRAALVSSGLRADAPTAMPAASAAASQRRSRPGSGKVRPTASGPDAARSANGQPDTKIIARLA
ncbi:ATP-binding protein [Frankia gtarii]|uniref:ATP-binding protein n=1 Tax=Frankia gtarii TaxID=2950102 RepID=UPI0034D7B05B